MSRLASAADVGATITAVVFTVVNVKSGQFSVTASVGYSDNSTVAVSDSSGKVRKFKTIDDFLSAAVKAGVINSNSTTVDYSFSNVLALEPVPYAGDLTKKAVADIASITKQIEAAGLVVANLTTQIALYPANTTAGEAVAKAEKVAQKDSTAALSAWLVSEKARIQAIIAG